MVYHYLKNLDILQFIRFVAVGVLNTVFGYAVFALLVWAGLPASVALFISTIIGASFNFLTTGRLVFNNRDVRVIWRFMIVYGLVYLINLGLLKMVQTWGIALIPAQGLCLFATVPLSFIIQKLFVFKEMANEDH